MKKALIAILLGVSGCAAVRDTVEAVAISPVLLIRMFSEAPQFVGRSFSMWENAITATFDPISMLNRSERRVIDEALRKAENDCCPDTFYGDFFIIPTVDKNAIDPFTTRQEPNGYSAVSIVAKLDMRRYKLIAIKFKRVDTLEEAVIAIHEHTGYTQSYIMKTHILRQQEQIREVKLKLVQERR